MLVVWVIVFQKQKNNLGLTPLVDIKTEKKYILLFKIYQKQLNITGESIFLSIKSSIKNAHLGQNFWKILEDS